MKTILAVSACMLMTWQTRAQTMWNIKLIDLMMLQKITPCYGLQLENNKLRLEFETPYLKNADESRFMESTSHPDKAKRFVHARLGITAIQSNPVSKHKVNSGYVKGKYLGNGKYALKWVTVHSVFDDNVIFEPGIDYYQYYVTTKGDAQIFGTNGQPIGAVVGTNMRAVSGYARLTLNRNFGSSIGRFFLEYLHSVSMSFEDVRYGMVTTGIEPGHGSGFEVRKWGLRGGIELYAKKFVSTRFVLGTAPGIKGRNAFATYINLGIPLVLERE